VNDDGILKARCLHDGRQGRGWQNWRTHTDRTADIVTALGERIPEARLAKSGPPHGFGRATIHGLQSMSGDAVVIMMADESDDCRDVVRYWNLLNQGWDAVFGSRFMKGGGVIDYPWLKLRINRIANLFIRLMFGISVNDTTNAFKAYRRTSTLQWRFH
jgi:dolichol-phosphate mannosyltransferase